ncbi:MAG: TonB-dependent receptor [Deltaproteobacteria bacterium]|nr:TonB-dependent receptor [Deltaproteobacteria bacterium]
MTGRIWVVLIFFLLLYPGFVCQSWGAGFAIFTQGASSLGQAAAVVAHTNGPSAIFFNPALLNDLGGTQVEVGTTLLSFNRSFKSSTDGRGHAMDDDLYFPSTFYLSHACNDRVTVGLGVFSPFGLATDWDPRWEGRYISTRAEMTTYTLNPVVSVRVTPRLSLAGGVNFVWADAELENKIPAYPLADINQKFKGDDFGVGFNLGLAFQATERITLGLSYRSEVDLTVTGDASFRLPDPGLGAYFSKTGGKADQTLPRQVFAGIAWQITEPLTVETGVRWEDWSSNERMKIKLDRPIGPPGSAVSEKIVPRDWRDTWAYNLGVTYRLNDHVALLAGYLYGENPVPNSTFDPSIPDSDTHLFTLGTDLTFGNLLLSLSYGYQKQENRRKNNLVGAEYAALGGTANGRYETDVHLAALSVGYRF